MVSVGYIGTGVEPEIATGPTNWSCKEILVSLANAAYIVSASRNSAVIEPVSLRKAFSIGSALNPLLPKKNRLFARVSVCLIDAAVTFAIVVGLPPSVVTAVLPNVPEVVHAPETSEASRK